MFSVLNKIRNISVRCAKVKLSNLRSPAKVFSRLKSSTVQIKGATKKLADGYEVIYINKSIWLTVLHGGMFALIGSLILKFNRDFQIFVIPTHSPDSGESTVPPEPKVPSVSNDTKAPTDPQVSADEEPKSKNLFVLSNLEEQVRKNEKGIVALAIFYIAVKYFIIRRTVRMVLKKGDQYRTVFYGFFGPLRKITVDHGSHVFQRPTSGTDFFYRLNNKRVILLYDYFKSKHDYVDLLQDTK